MATTPRWRIVKGKTDTGRTGRYRPERAGRRRRSHPCAGSGPSDWPLFKIKRQIYGSMLGAGAADADQICRTGSSPEAAARYDPAVWHRTAPAAACCLVASQSRLLQKHGFRPSLPSGDLTRGLLLAEPRARPACRLFDFRTDLECLRSDHRLCRARGLMDLDLPNQQQPS